MVFRIDRNAISPPGVWAGPLKQRTSFAARQLRASQRMPVSMAAVNGVRLSVDEWMHTMFSADLPEKMDMTSVLPRVVTCQAQVW